MNRYYFWFIHNLQYLGDKTEFFTDWLAKTFSGSIFLYLGGSYHRKIISCFNLSNGILTQDLLKWDHEGVDDRIMFHVNHTVKVDNFSKVMIASTDADVSVCALYHFSCWMHSGLDEPWIAQLPTVKQIILMTYTLSCTIKNRFN